MPSLLTKYPNFDLQFSNYKLRSHTKKHHCGIRLGLYNGENATRRKDLFSERPVLELHGK